MWCRLQSVHIRRAPVGGTLPWTTRLVTILFVRRAYCNVWQSCVGISQAFYKITWWFFPGSAGSDWVAVPTAVRVERSNSEGAGRKDASGIHGVCSISPSMSASVREVSGRWDIRMSRFTATPRCSHALHCWLSQLCSGKEIAEVVPPISFCVVSLCAAISQLHPLQDGYQYDQHPQHTGSAAVTWVHPPINSFTHSHLLFVHSSAHLS